MSSLWQTLRDRWKITVPVAVVALTGAGLAIAWGVGAFDANEPTAEIASPAAVEPVIEPDPDPEPKPAPEPDADPLVSVDSVQHMPYTEVWNPPDQGEGFWQVVDPAHGYYEEGGTKYVLAHACEIQVCAGDQFLKLGEGDAFDYLGATYKVDDKYSIHKDNIADQPIWDNVDGRVVIVTCIIEGNWEDSDHNEIFVASPAG